MKTPSFSPRRGPSQALAATVLLGASLLVPFAHSAESGKKKNPTSKVYVADINGEALIDTGESIEDMTKRSVYTAEGTVIETKRPESEADRAKHFSTMVYSNGTGAFFDADTRVELRRFSQEPFTPNRTDIETEPSISQTQAFVARGTVGLCTSKLVAGSNMTYQTPLGSVNIRGRKVVIEAAGDVTKISMLEGDSTVRGGPQDVSGYTLHAGEQALIRRGAPGQANIVQIQRIPPAEAPQLDDKVAMACMAKKTVYFEVRDKKDGSSNSANNDNGQAGDGGTGGTVTAFDGNSNPGNNVTREIVPVEIIPVNLPVQFTVSPATIITPNGQVVTPGQGTPGPGQNPGP